MSFSMDLKAESTTGEQMCSQVLQRMMFEPYDSIKEADQKTVIQEFAKLFFQGTLECSFANMNRELYQTLPVQLKDKVRFIRDADGYLDQSLSQKNGGPLSATPDLLNKTTDFYKEHAQKRTDLLVDLYRKNKDLTEYLKALNDFDQEYVKKEMSFVKSNCLTTFNCSRVRTAALKTQCCQRRQFIISTAKG